MEGGGVGGGSGAGGGGFHGFDRVPQPTSTTSTGLKYPVDISMGLPTLDQHPQQTSIMNHTNNHHNSDENNNNECRVREQDRFMPIANVIRIMRRILPSHAKISDDAKETIQECVSEYISFVTGEANERCQREQRKTITAEDVLWAMSKLGFDDYIEPLTLYLSSYRELDGGDRGSLRGEPLVMMKRSPSTSNTTAAAAAADGHMFAFAPGGPTFHLGPFFGAATAAGAGPTAMGAGHSFLNDAPTKMNGSASSQSAVASHEPYAKCKE